MYTQSWRVDSKCMASCFMGCYPKSAAAAAAATKSLQSCLTLCESRRQPTRLPHPWDSPGKNTGVGCQFLLQCVKVKSESEVAQSCPTLSDSMDCSSPGSSIHGIFQARVLSLLESKSCDFPICAWTSAGTGSQGRARRDRASWGQTTGYTWLPLFSTHSYSFLRNLREYENLLLKNTQ